MVKDKRLKEDEKAEYQLDREAELADERLHCCEECGYWYNKMNESDCPGCTLAEVWKKAKSYMKEFIMPEGK